MTELNKPPIVTCRHQRGLNLLEAIFALAIISILLQLALPVFGITDREESTRILGDLAGFLEMARSSAISGHRTVTICPTLDGSQCTNNWQTGAIAFVDDNHDRRRNRDEPLLHHLAWREIRGTLAWRAFGNRQSLQIDPYGGLLNQNGNFTWCPPPDSSEPAHQLVINSAGRLRLARDTDGDGIREDSSGRALVC
jgi:type IV fimbrial biogenesis protein FimT